MISEVRLEGNNGGLQRAKWNYEWDGEIVKTEQRAEKPLGSAEILASPTYTHIG